MTEYINTSWDHPHLYGTSEYDHGIQMGADYVMRLRHGGIMRPAAVSVTRDGVYCGKCGTEVTRAWHHAQSLTDPKPDVVTYEKGQPPTVNGEPVDVEPADDDQELRTNHAELVEEHAELGTLYRDVVQERDALQAQVRELQAQRDDTTADLNRQAQRAGGAEYALRSLQQSVAGMAKDFDQHTTSPRPDYIAKRLRNMLPPTIRDAWGLAGWWATDRTLGDVHVVSAEADNDGRVEVLYMDAGKPVQGYAYVGALTNWRTTR